jgi:hypothetical protein
MKNTFADFPIAAELAKKWVSHDAVLHDAVKSGGLMPKCHRFSHMRTDQLLSLSMLLN